MPFIKKYNLKTKKRYIPKKRKTVSTQYLSKQINTLKAQTKKQWNWEDYRLDIPTDTILGDATGVSAVYSLPLVQPSSWTAMWSTASARNFTNEMYLTSMKSSICFTANWETSPVQFDLYMVRLRPKLARQATEGTVYLQNMNANEHYITRSGGTQNTGWELNRNVFNVLHHRRFTLGAHATQNLNTINMTTRSSYMRNYTFSYKPKTPIRIESLDSNAATMTKDNVRYQDQVYLLVFCNNSTIDGENPLVNGVTSFKVKYT